MIKNNIFKTLKNIKKQIKNLLDSKYVLYKILEKNCF